MSKMNIFFVLLIFIGVVKATKMRKLIDFLDKDAPKEMEKLPNYNEESIAFQRNKKFNPCLENPNICSNSGKCESENGNFYCICPKTHYGKTCEHIADQTNCANHLCQNNATCVSVKDKRTIVNTVLLNDIRTWKPATVELTDAELAKLDLEVQYECICQRGTFGTLCDESEADRTCQEVYCLGRGKGRMVAGNCTCECEKQYFGDRCEQLSACFDTQCDNGGVCQDTVDWKTKTVRADCKCPAQVEIVGGSISGENCEKLTIPGNVPKELMPCEPGRNSSMFFKKLIAQIDLSLMADEVELEEIQNDYHDGKINNGKVMNGWCENGGKCVPEVVRVKSGNAYYIYRCECTNPLTDGYYCEYKRQNACGLTRNEIARGARDDEKCTDLAHGACIDILGEPKCVCKPDYTGETCEIYDPCARHPCKHGDCIPTPNSADTSFGTKTYQCLCPLSAKLSKDNECVQIKDKKCPVGACGHGRCVPCDTDSLGDDDMMPLCNANEKSQGFRCLCEAGFIGPFCKTHTNPCHQNLCQNSATCKVNQQRSYDCMCLNGTRGSLCEIIDDSCDAFGNNICKHGVCVNDEYYHRGFSCECDDDFEGLNCNSPISRPRVFYKRVMKHYQFTVPLAFCSASLLILLVVVIRSRNEGKVSDTPVESVLEP